MESNTSFDAIGKGINALAYCILCYVDEGMQNSHGMMTSGIAGCHIYTHYAAEQETA